MSETHTVTSDCADAQHDGTTPAPTVGDDLDELVKSLRYGDQHASAAECRNDLCNCAIMEEAATALTTLRERVARLEGVLEPFADAADRIRSDLPDDCALLHYEDDAILSLGQLRRARTAIGE